MLVNGSIVDTTGGYKITIQGAFSKFELVQGTARSEDFVVTMDGHGNDHIDFLKSGDSYSGPLDHYRESGKGVYRFRDGGLILCNFVNGTCPKGSYHKDGNQQTITVSPDGKMKVIPDNLAPVSYPPASPVIPDSCPDRTDQGQCITPGPITPY